MSVCQLRPESRGYVRVKSSDPMAAPAIAAALPVDADGPRDAGRWNQARAAFAARPPRFRRTSPVNTCLAREADNDEDLLEFARSSGATIFPPFRHAARWDLPRTHSLVGRCHNCACAGSITSAWSIAASCPRSFPGTRDARVIMIAEKAADMILRSAAGRTIRHQGDAPCPAAIRISLPSKAATAVSPSACRRSRSAPASSPRPATAPASSASSASRFSPTRASRKGEYVATVRGFARCGAGRLCRLRRCLHRTTDASVQDATRFATEGRFDGYVSVGRRLGDGHMQGGKLYASQPAGIHDVRQCADRRGARRCRAR